MFDLFRRKLSKHDRAVREEVQELRMAGFEDIRADLPGMEKPRSRHGRRPDIVARRGGDVFLKEIETRESLEGDHSQEQREAFGEWEAENPLDRDFSVEKADSSLFDL